MSTATLTCSMPQHHKKACNDVRVGAAGGLMQGWASSMALQPLTRRSLAGALQPVCTLVGRRHAD